jgi:hypothetical protein
MRSRFAHSQSGLLLASGSRRRGVGDESQTTVLLHNYCNPGDPCETGSHSSPVEAYAPAAREGAGVATSSGHTSTLRTFRERKLYVRESK